MTREELLPIKKEMFRLALVTLDQAIDGKASAENALKSIQVFDAVHAMVCRELGFESANEHTLMDIAQANGIIQSFVAWGSFNTDELCEALDHLQKASRRMRGAEHGP